MSSPVSRRLKGVIAATTTGYADLSQTELLHFFKHSAVFVVFPAYPPQPGQDIVAWSVFILVGLLLFIGLSSPRVRLEENIE